MIYTVLTIFFAVVVLGFTATIILLVAFLAKLLWDYIFDNC